MYRYNAKQHQRTRRGANSIAMRIGTLVIGIMLFLSLLLPFVVTQAVDIASEASLPPNYQVQTFAGTGLGRTRGLHVLPNGDVLMIKAQSRRVTTDDSSVILFWDDDNDGVADGQHVLVAPGHDLTHGVEFVLPENNARAGSDAGEGLLLASSDRTVFAWPYTPGDRSATLGEGKPLVTNMNAKAANDDLGAFKGHWTRTLALSPSDQRYLHISVGSDGNVDIDSYRSRIRRVDLSSSEDSFDFRDAEIFADGLRNEVGLDFDSKGVLWGVENGADRLFRSDLGGDIHEDNPAEELNKFDGPVGTFYGYPFCWTEYNLPSNVGLGRGTQWSWPGYTTSYGDGWSKSDAWCRANSRGPEFAMQGHSAPLGMDFFDHSKYDPEKCRGKGTFPAEVDGHLFVGFHGSWNRDIPTGYKVVQIPFDRPGGSPTDGDALDLIAHAGNSAKWPSGVRPVDVQFDQCGRLLVTDDGTQSIFAITYDGESFSAPFPVGTSPAMAYAETGASNATVEELLPIEVDSETAVVEELGEDKIAENKMMSTENVDFIPSGSGRSNDSSAAFSASATIGNYCLLLTFAALAMVMSSYPLM